ncbi:hypothetical protein PUN28_018276 [Cardiocondyla obscurior]|uniref:Uncharacterized protein n=1 Tax=Cardiocondyla obscurior TaxID=286306 RepID=A0AAW2EM01_9HYME
METCNKNVEEICNQSRESFQGTEGFARRSKDRLDNRRNAPRRLTSIISLCNRRSASHSYSKPLCRNSTNRCHVHRLLEISISKNRYSAGILNQYKVYCDFLSDSKRIVRKKKKKIKVS